jgi:hypothetical protein
MFENAILTDILLHCQLLEYNESKAEEEDAVEEDTDSKQNKKEE